ncbi:hypothetical protein Tsp_15716 [Trichinella spiralis]|uniref:hypothetical protein n=1 Tax=Trichinella spiralis TaxID=6334 RepID=UPI0001EFF001|nr:hypothetical protein Tsp_15716 [Trichinella spiralis]
MPSLGTPGRTYEGATPVFRQGLLTFSSSFFVCAAYPPRERWELAGCLYVKALHLLQGTGLIAVVDINRAAYIAEGLPTTVSTCSTEPKSTPFLQRARVIEV